MALDFLNIEEQENTGQSPAETVLSAAGAAPVVPISNPYANTLSGFSGNNSPQVYAAPPSDAIQEQGFFDYFPSMRNEIQKGYYTGQMIGSNPIYSPALLMPYGLIDARQRALQRAADKKVAEQKAFADKIAGLRTPETQHKAVQPEITNMFYSGLKEDIASAQKKYGADWAKNLWQDPTFHQKIQTVKDVAGYEDVAVKHVADVEHMSETGDYALTPAIQQAINDFKTGKYSLLSMSSDPEKQAEARKIFHLGPIKDAVKMSKVVAQGIQADITEFDPNITSNGLYDILTSTTIKSTDAQRIKDAVDNSWKALYGGREDLVGINKNEYYKLVAANFGKERTTTVQTPSTQGGRGLGFQMSEKDLKEGETEIISTAGGGKTGTFGIQDYYPLPAGIKPFEMASTTKIMDVEGNETASGSMIGNKKVSPSGVGNVYKIHKKGDKNDGKAIKESDIARFKKDGYEIRVTPVAILSVLRQDTKGNDYVSGTITTEIDDVRNGIEQRGKDGKYVGGVNSDVIKKRALQRQQEINNMKIYTDDQEALIKKNMDANPDYSREEIINALGI